MRGWRALVVPLAWLVALLTLLDMSAGAYRVMQAQAGEEMVRVKRISKVQA